MSTSIRLFPSSRRRGLIRHVAAMAAGYARPAARENAIRSVLDGQVATLRRRGFDDKLIEADISTLSQAIRTELTRLLHLEGVA
jgi:hypothetical protein